MDEAPAETPLAFEFVNRYPDGTVDDCTYGAIEDALDVAEAPMTEGRRWLTLPERIAGLAAERDALRARLAALEGPSPD